MITTATELTCWCGCTETKETANAAYACCASCGSAILRNPHGATEEISAPQSWESHQEELGFPKIKERARLDLPERCTYWLGHVLRYATPGGRVLELGAAHGGFLKLLQLAGFVPFGIEMSEEVIADAKKWFGIDM